LDLREEFNPQSTPKPNFFDIRINQVSFVVLHCGILLPQRTFSRGFDAPITRPLRMSLPIAATVCLFAAAKHDQ
jgi:hypothetical protein